jgi:hypothetical protein
MSLLLLLNPNTSGPSVGWGDAWDEINLQVGWTTSMTLDTGVGSTDRTTIPVALSATSSAGTVTHTCWSEDGVTYGSWETYSTTPSYTFETEDLEEKTIYAKFKDDDDNESPALSESIELVAPAYPGAYIIINAI